MPPTIAEPRPQQAIQFPAFDTWREPGGTIVATFHRIDAASIVVRFPGTADFRVDTTTGEVRATPVASSQVDAARVLLENSIAPLVANHSGGTNLHGSAADVAGRGVAFIGVSRRGKSTLAVAFARAGYPLVTEDVLELRHGATGWTVKPHEGAVRLFPDSVRGLGFEGAGTAKAAVRTVLPRAAQAVPLERIYLLGDGSAKRITIASVSGTDALAGLLRHAFILDVEHRPRLAAHFDRLAGLAATVPCRLLDYPRRYELLPMVVETVVDDLAQT